MRILEKDLFILNLLDKLRILNINLISELAKINRGTCKNRLKKLYDEGMVRYYQACVSSERYYTLTTKGINYIYPAEKRISKKGQIYNFYRKPPKLNLRTLEHEIKVAYVLKYLLKYNEILSVNDFKTEREIQREISNYKKIKGYHICDLLCEKFRLKIEVELSIKNKKDLADNIISNGSSCIQIWIVGNDSLYKRILKEKEYLKKKYMIEIIKFDDLDEKIIKIEDLYEKLIKNY